LSKRTTDLSRLESMLSGDGYYPFFRVSERLHNMEKVPSSQLLFHFPNAAVGGVSMNISTATAMATIEECLLSTGDWDFGPPAGIHRRPDFCSLVSSVLREFENDCKKADSVYEFWLRSGHPAYPVFWGFSLLLVMDGGRRSRVWLGSCSD